MKKSALASHSYKTLVRAAVQAYLDHFVVFKSNDNHYVLHDKLFVIIRT